MSPVAWCLGINRHLNPKPDSIQLHPTAVGRPLGASNHRPEPCVDLRDSDFRRLRASSKVWPCRNVRSIIGMLLLRTGTPDTVLDYRHMIHSRSPYRFTARGPVLFPGMGSFESHDGVAQRRTCPWSDAPLFAITLVYWAVGPATIQNHHQTWHTGESRQEVLVEICIGPAHDDQHLGIRKRPRGGLRARALCGANRFLASSLSCHRVPVHPSHDLHPDRAAPPRPRRFGVTLF
jgi:hypothetical protein